MCALSVHFLSSRFKCVKLSNERLNTCSLLCLHVYCSLCTCRSTTQRFQRSEHNIWHSVTFSRLAVTNELPLLTDRRRPQLGSPQLSFVTFATSPSFKLEHSPLPVSPLIQTPRHSIYRRLQLGSVPHQLHQRLSPKRLRATKNILSRIVYSVPDPPTAFSTAAPFAPPIRQ